MFTRANRKATASHSTCCAAGSSSTSPRSTTACPPTTTGTHRRHGPMNKFAEVLTKSEVNDLLTAAYDENYDKLIAYAQQIGEAVNYSMPHAVGYLAILNSELMYEYNIEFVPRDLSDAGAV